MIENREKEIYEILKMNEGILTGHFCLTSGLHSNIYFQCAKLYQNPKIVEKLAKLLLEKLKNIKFDTIISPAIGAIIFGYEVAKQAGCRNLFVERKDGILQLRRGYTLEKGEKVLIIEDVVTTARTIKETIDAIKAFEPEIVNQACIVDRTSGKPTKNKNTEHFCDNKREKAISLNLISLLKIDPEIYDPKDCPLCKDKLPIIKPGSRVNA